MVSGVRALALCHISSGNEVKEEGPKTKTPRRGRGALFYAINYTIDVPHCQGRKEIF